MAEIFREDFNTTSSSIPSSMEAYANPSYVYQFTQDGSNLKSVADANLHACIVGPVDKPFNLSTGFIELDTSMNVPKNTIGTYGFLRLEIIREGSVVYEIRFQNYWSDSLLYMKMFEVGVGDVTSQTTSHTWSTSHTYSIKIENEVVKWVVDDSVLHSYDASSILGNNEGVSFGISSSPSNGQTTYTDYVSLDGTEYVEFTPKVMMF